MRKRGFGVRRRLALASALSGFVIVMTASELGALTRPMSYPTYSQIQGQLALSARQNNIPDGEILPGIGVSMSVDFLMPHPRWSECAVVGSSIEITATTIAHCTFGDRSASTTIGIYGDSNAAMWAPAFDIYGALQHRRIIVLAHMGCTTWPRPWIKSHSTSANAISERDCAQWRRNVLSAFRKAHADFVLPVSIDTSGVHDVMTTTKLTKSLSANFDQIRRYSLAPFALNPVPRYTFKTDYLNCISANPTSLRRCMIETNAVGANRLNRAFSSATQSRSVPMVATTDLFCARLRCPIFLAWEGRNIQIHRDGQHITAAYAQLVSAALAPRITTALSQAR